MGRLTVRATKDFHWRRSQVIVDGEGLGVLADGDISINTIESGPYWVQITSYRKIKIRIAESDEVLITVNPFSEKTIANVDRLFALIPILLMAKLFIEKVDDPLLGRMLCGGVFLVAVFSFCWKRYARTRIKIERTLLTEPPELDERQMSFDDLLS